MAAGSHPLTGVASLPNVTIAFPGEHWSDRIASGAITPGAAVVPVNSGGKLAMKVASAESNLQVAVATRPIDIPEPEHPRALGPTEVRNQSIANQEYVHAYYSGVFLLTLVDPRRTYTPGQLIGWDPSGQRPTGKSGTGSWAPDANAAIDSVFEVQEVRAVGSAGEVILRVRSLRGQF